MNRQDFTHRLDFNNYAILDNEVDPIARIKGIEWVVAAKLSSTNIQPIDAKGSPPHDSRAQHRIQCGLVELFGGEPD